MQPYIRKFNYIQDYYWTQNQWAEHLNVAAYPVTYYNVDMENSVYDTDLMAGSYEKEGVGALSGIRWRKIQMLPVYWPEAIQPQYTADEKGLTLSDSMLSSLVVPDVYDIRPSEWDFIHFSQEFMLKGSNFFPLFVVKGTELSTYGDITYRKLNLKVAGHEKLQKLELQLSGRYMFLEFTKKIHEIQTASMLLKLELKNQNLASDLMNLYHSTGLYIS